MDVEKVEVTDADKKAARAAQADMIVGGFQGDRDVWRKVEERFAAHRLSPVKELLEALEGIFAKLDDGPSAPGHGHSIPGIWDDDMSNGERAGKPCEWCAHWGRARTLVSQYRGALQQEQSK